MAGARGWPECASVGVHTNAREPKFAGVDDYCRQRPTLPHSSPCSTIGGIRLNFRVRNGNGCDPDPMTTGILAAWGPASVSIAGAAGKPAAARGNAAIALYERRLAAVRAGGATA